MNKKVENEIKKVHVVFKTHLDIGFTDLSKNVIQEYMDLYIPETIKLGNELKGNRDISFKWTTGSWLIYHCLRTLKGYELNKLVDAINDGIINWHGLPFTTHTELMDKDLFEYGVSLSEKLDKQFDRETIAAKMSDVPGHTKAIIPSLHKANIQFLHLGIDPALAIPEVPKFFTWVGANGTEIVVNYSYNNGQDSLLPGMDEILHLAHTNDKGRPYSIQMVVDEFNNLREKYPNAEIVASTLDDYAKAVICYKDSLPRVYEEIGDSWIHGAASDPSKISMFRELLRLRKKWISTGKFKNLENELEEFSLNLLLIPEHTWGVDINNYLADYMNYSKTSFLKARESAAHSDKSFNSDTSTSWGSSYNAVEKSWEEQREYIYNAISALPEELSKEAQQSLNNLSPLIKKKAEIDNQLYIDKKYEFSNFLVEFDKNGAISFLHHEDYGDIFDNINRCGLFLYGEIGKESYDFWFNTYIKDFVVENNWSYEYFGKPLMESEGTITSEYTVSFDNGFYSNEGEFVTVVLNLSPNKYIVKNLGCPENIQIVYKFYNTKIDIDLVWQNKDPLRLPESIWFSINPKVGNENMWFIEKMGELISPLQVVKNGGRNLHALDHYIHYLGAEKKLRISSLDAPLVAMGERKILKFDNTVNLTEAASFNLYNNIWGTNYKMWYDEDTKFRFTIELS